MSTIIAENISDGTDSTATGNVVKGSAKAWHAYNQVTNTLLESLNISSITDTGASGKHLVTLTNSFATAYYAIASWSKSAATQANSGSGGSTATSGPTTTGFEAYWLTGAGSGSDAPYGAESMTGDLA